MKRGRRLKIEQPSTRPVYYPNALGRYAETDEWQPIHVTADGLQVDFSGLNIKPFWEVHRKTPAEIDAFLKANNLVLFRMEPAMVPMQIVRQ